MPALDWSKPGADAARLLPRCSAAAAGGRDYTARRALFLQSYQFSVREGLSERLRRRLRETGEAGRRVAAKALVGGRRAAAKALGDGRWLGATVARALRLGWQPVLGCFSLKQKYYLEDFI